MTNIRKPIKIVTAGELKPEDIFDPKGSFPGAPYGMVISCDRSDLPRLMEAVMALSDTAKDGA